MVNRFSDLAVVFFVGVREMPELIKSQKDIDRRVTRIAGAQTHGADYCRRGSGGRSDDLSSFASSEATKKVKLPLVSRIDTSRSLCCPLKNLSEEERMHTLPTYPDEISDPLIQYWPRLNVSRATSLSV